MITAKPGQTRITAALYVRNSDAKAPELVKLHAECGPLDFDEPQPAITVMMLGDD